VWQRLTSVLQVLPGGAQFDVAMDAAGESSWTEQPPDDSARQVAWANWWAAQRLAAKQSRDFTESDRIRALLDQHGWEVRDNRDGTATVQRN
jgi:cysteinyl-tRNA synthetase